MYVIYDGQNWWLPACRGSLFEDFQKSDPERLVWIYRNVYGHQVSKRVQIKKLRDYITYRNS